MVKIPNSLDVYWRYQGGASDSWNPVTLYLNTGLFVGKVLPTPGAAIEIDHQLLGAKNVVADTIPRRTLLRLPAVQHLYGDSYSIDVAPYFTGTNLVYTAFADNDGVVSGFNFTGSVLSYTVGDKNFIGNITVRATNSAGTVTSSYPFEIDDFPPGFDVYVLAGCLNMVGRYGPIDPLLDAPNPRIYQYAFTAQGLFIAEDPLDHGDEAFNTVGLGLSFGKAMLPTIPSNRSIILVPAGTGLSGFSNGYLVSGGQGDEQTIATTNQAMLQGSGLNKLKAILWHQGESDKLMPPLSYQVELDALISRWRASMTGATSQTPFLVGQTLIGGTATSADITNVHATVGDRVEKTAFVPSTGLLGGVDNISFTAASQRVLGSRYFQQYQYAITNTAGPPGEIVDLVVTAGETTAALSWSAPPSNLSPITDYLIQFKPRKLSVWSTFADGVSSATGATVTGLSRGTVYDFRVYAVNANGTGPSSNVASAVTALVTPPSAISDLIGVPDTTKVQLSWTVPSANGSPITDYVVEYKDAATCSWSVFSDGVSTTPSALVTGLVNDTAYDFRVSAINSIGVSPWSNVITETPAIFMVEPGAARHWIFGADNTSNTDQVSLLNMIQVGAAPSHPGPFVRLTNGFLNGLRSDYGIGLPAFTVCVVVRFPTISPGVICGNLSATQGAGILLASGALVNGIMRGASTNTLISMPSTVDWYFLAMSFSITAGGLDYLGSTAGPEVFVRPPGAYTQNFGVHFGIGNLAFPAAFPQGFDFAEFIIFNQALTQAQIDAVYSRSTARLASRSVVLF